MVNEAGGSGYGNLYLQSMETAKTGGLSAPRYYMQCHGYHDRLALTTFCSLLAAFHHPRT
jgi:hypothetical protein